MEIVERDRNKCVGTLRGWRVASLLLGALALAACGDGDAEGGAAKSGLPGELTLTSLSDENREVFCDWYDSVAPSEEACPSNTEEGETQPTCLEKFEHFGSCTVEAVESCFASASASSCELPDSDACEAFEACQEEAAPANDCPDSGFTCKKSTGFLSTWTGDSQRWGTCWSWWPPGCHKCHGSEPSFDEAKAWCESRHPEECKGKSCYPSGGGYDAHP